MMRDAKAHEITYSVMELVLMIETLERLVR